MQTHNIQLPNADVSDIKNVLHDFSNTQRYVLKTNEASVDEAYVTLYDRKPESPSLMSFLETFATRRFVSDRIRILIDITSDKQCGGSNVLISGDVVMAEIDIVEPNPRRSSLDKLNDVLRDLLERLQTIGKEIHP